MDSIYILRLNNDKWYVGRTANVERRFEQHKKGEGSKWTFLHQPINIHEVRECKSDDDEDNVTIEYMKQFGIYNVRGGRFCAVELKPWNVKEIKGAIEEKENDRKMKEFGDKVKNELFNPDSDLRSGRWIRGLFGGK
jgi:predicted GIY-YIG superfamily endonuclease